MAGRQVRNAEQTRRELLAAATRVLIERGPTASLDAIAKVAGVSKGGLLHHFPTRDDLFLALVRSQLEQFRRLVDEAHDPADTAPGRLTRTYIRAAFRDIADLNGRAHEQAILLGHLGTQPHLMEIVAADSAEWNAKLLADGLDEQRVVLIVRAVDGTSMTSLYEGRLTPEDAARTESWLLDLTRGEGPLR